MPRAACRRVRLLCLPRRWRCPGERSFSPDASVLLPGTASESLSQADAPPPPPPAAGGRVPPAACSSTPSVPKSMHFCMTRSSSPACSCSVGESAASSGTRARRAALRRRAPSRAADSDVWSTDTTDRSCFTKHGSASLRVSATALPPLMSRFPRASSALWRMLTSTAGPKPQSGEGEQRWVRRMEMSLANCAWCVGCGAPDGAQQWCTHCGHALGILKQQVANTTQRVRRHAVYWSCQCVNKTRHT